MANRRYESQFLYSFHAQMVALDCRFQVGATGAVGELVGPGIASVTRLSAGRYQIKLQDNYKQLYSAIPSIYAPVTGSAIDPNAASVGTVYQITTVGNTNWTTAGLPAGLTPTVGQVLKLAAQPPAGTGRVKAIGASGIMAVEVLGNPANAMLSPIANPIDGVKGGLVTIQCLGATAADDTALIPTDPAEGSQLQLLMLLSNSSVVIQGE